MNFGDALVCLKEGKKVARRGWNGKDMFLVFIRNWEWSTNNPTVAGYPRLEFIAMKTVDEHLVPWLASQTDMAAEDWFHVH